jgi:hypothetical protein
MCLLQCVSYFLAEFRNVVSHINFSPIFHLMNSFSPQFLALSNSSGSQACAFRCPLWYAFLSRGMSFTSGTASAMLHFAVMLERWRATAQARNYEGEGLHFGVFSLLAVVSQFMIIITKIQCNINPPIVLRKFKHWLH